MIPLKLYIKNFLSYGNQPQVVNFEPYQLICLSGKNGHGKSALLDAITWALWGCARKVQGCAKSDEQLIRSGSADMVVALDFMSGGVKYRVRRELSCHKAKAITRLDFGIVEVQDSDRFRALTEKTMRETQARITRTIGLEYEAFENSAFIRQGQSHEFSKKSPKERKELLGSMIGTTIYEQLRKQALEIGKNAQSEALLIERAIAALQAELAQESAIQTTHTTTLEQIKRTEQEYTIQLAQSEAFTQEYHALHIEQSRIRAESARAQQLAAQHQALTDKFLQLSKVWRTTHASLRHTRTAAYTPPDTASITARLTTLQSTLASFPDIAQRLLEAQAAHAARSAELARICAQADAAFTQACHTQTLAITHSTHRLAQEEARIQRYQLHHQELMLKLAQLNETTAHAAAQQAHLQQLEGMLERNRARYYRSRSDLAQRLSRERMLIIQSHALQTNAATCHQCTQPLTAQHVSYCIKRLTQKMDHGSTRILWRKACLDRSRENMRNLYAQIEELRQHIQPEGHTHALKLEIQQAIQQNTSEAVTAHAALECAQQQLTHAQNIVLPTRPSSLVQQDDSILAAHMLRIQELQAMHHSLNAQQKEYQELSTALAQQHADHLRYTSVLQEAHSQRQRMKDVRELGHMHRTLRKELVQYTQLRTHDQALTIQLAHVEKQLTTAQARATQLLEQRQTLFTQKGALEQSLEHLGQRRTLLNSEKQRLQMLANTAHVHTLLAQALSKDGIQGMLIETILPEIEAEANLLLQRLTENETHIYFESLRELKSGSYKETLEIKISDAHGIRPYEMFSGGEAFRIDFALRLAIAQFLARRAGTSIQTLIIDEGFGSQDDEGLSYIMEALHAIQDKFAKIIIVSHLPHMKEQFPTHFQVTKHMQGSSVRVIEQG